MPHVPPTARLALRALRQTEGWSLLDVAAAAGVSLWTVRRIDRGDVAGLKLLGLVKVAQAVGCRAVDLVPGLASAPRGPCAALVSRRRSSPRPA